MNMKKRRDPQKAQLQTKKEPKQINNATNPSPQPPPLLLEGKIFKRF
jgi:hypothetical protein